MNARDDAIRQLMESGYSHDEVTGALARLGDSSAEVERWPEYDDLCLTCAGRGWVDLLPLTRAPGAGPREDCRDCGGTGRAPQ